MFTVGALAVGGFSFSMITSDDGGIMPIGAGIGLMAAPVAVCLAICAVIGWVSVLT